MPVLELKNVSLYYELDRHDDRSPLVLSNSLGTNLDLWSQQVRVFSEHFSVLRYDLRGQGRSSAPPGPYGLAAMGEDLLALLDALKIDRVHFCGISMSGLIGQWLGIHAPERLHRLVLSNTAAKIGSEALWNERIATVQTDGLEPLVHAIVNGWFTESFRREHPDAIAKAQAMLRANDREGYAACCAAVRDADFREAVSAIKTPTLIVWSTEDRSTTPEQGRFLLDHIADSQQLTLHSAHISNIEAANAFTAGVLQFLHAASG